MQSTPTEGHQRQTARPTRNIAARAARWSTQHRKTAVFGWLAFVIVAFAIGSFVIGNSTLTKEESGVGESGRADLAAYEAFPEKAAEMVFVHSDEYDSDSPQFHAAVDDVRERLGAIEGVEALTNPYTETGGEVISPDGHSALVGYELPGDAIATKKSIDAPLAAIDASAGANPEFGIEAFGSASTEKEFKKSLDADLHKAEFISLPLTLVILLFTFGTLMAAGIPVLLALTAVLGTMGLLGR